MVGFSLSCTSALYDRSHRTERTNSSDLTHCAALTFHQPSAGRNAVSE